MAGIGGFVTRLNGGTAATNNFQLNTSITAVTSLTGFVAEVVKFSLPEVGLTDIDVSSMDSTENYLEYVSGSADPGVIDIELNYAKANDVLVVAALGDANEIWSLTFPDSSRWSCSGYVNKIGGGTSGPNEKMSRVLSIKCSGKPTHVTSI